MTPFNLFGVGGYTNPLLTSGSEDIDTSSIWGQMGANKRRAEYDNSLLGMVHNWATQEQRQPVQLPDDASWLDQLGEAGARIANFPIDMAAGGAKTMAHWLGAAGNPEMVEPLDMLAPLGIGAMAGMAGAVPRGAVGSAGGMVATNALDMSQEARMKRAKEMGFDTDNVLFHGTSGDDFEKFTARHQTGGMGLPGVYMTPDANYAATYSGTADGSRIMPLFVRGKIASPAEYQAIWDSVYDNTGGRFSGPALTRLVQDEMLRRGYTGKSSLYENEWPVVAVFDPRNIRSVNAAFDPAKADSANLLAADQARGSLPGLLAGAADEPTQDDELMRLLQLYGMMP